MANLLAWVLAAAWPVVKKVLLALGIGWLTYEGLSAVGAQINTQVATIWGTLPASVLQMASLLGIPQSIGIVLGGIAGRISLVAAGKLGKIST